MKKEELCIKKEELCIKKEELCIKKEELYIKKEELYIKQPLFIYKKVIYDIGTEIRMLQQIDHKTTQEAPTELSFSAEKS